MCKNVLFFKLTSSLFIAKYAKKMLRIYFKCFNLPKLININSEGGHETESNI